MRTRELKKFIKDSFGMDLFNNKPNLLPDSQEELDLPSLSPYT